ncbi:MAG TPA: hypothetical protein VF840_09745 [Terriglobales bacterium]
MLTFRLVPEMQPSTARAVGFLEGHNDLDAGAVFEGLSARDRKHFLFSVNLWVNTGRGPHERMHGFEKPYNDYWAFKNVPRGQRFYGYLMNPKPIWDERLRICVLTSYEQKKKDEMDYGILDNRVRPWKDSPNAATAVAYVFPDEEDEEGQ